jgi:dipeptidase E
MCFYNPRKWKYVNVKGLGLIKGIHCPHYNSRTLGVPRRRHFRDMISKIGGIGIAIENNCAIEFIDDKYYRVITSKSYAGAYTVRRRGGVVLSERVRMETRWMPVNLLYQA